MEINAVELSSTVANEIQSKINDNRDYGSVYHYHRFPVREEFDLTLLDFPFDWSSLEAQRNLDWAHVILHCVYAFLSERSALSCL